MNYGNFNLRLQSFLKRRNLLPAIIDDFVNMAVEKLQREFDFPFMTTDLLTTYAATKNVGITLPVNFKCFVGEGGVNFITVEGHEKPVTATTYEHKQFRKELDPEAFRPLEIVNPLSPANLDWTVSETYYYIVFSNDGVQLFLIPESLGVNLSLHYVAWITPYNFTTDGLREDFLLRHGHDVLTWATLEVANMYELEENRVPLDDKAYQVSLEKFQAYCENLYRNGGHIELE